MKEKARECKGGEAGGESRTPAASGHGVCGRARDIGSLPSVQGRYWSGG